MILLSLLSLSLSFFSSLLLTLTVTKGHPTERDVCPNADFQPCSSLQKVVRHKLCFDDLDRKRFFADNDCIASIDTCVKIRRTSLLAEYQVYRKEKEENVPTTDPPTQLVLDRGAKAGMGAKMLDRGPTQPSGAPCEKQPETWLDITVRGPKQTK